MASDELLLTIARISASLIGLFLVGMIFFIQTGFSRLEQSRSVVEPYFRASTRIVLIVFTIPLGVSLTMVALPVGWSRLLFIALVLGLIAANISTVGLLRPLVEATRSRLLWANEIVSTAAAAVMVVLPFITGGLAPDRNDLVPSILIALGLGFLSTCVLVLTLFDVAAFERAGLGSSADHALPAGNDDEGDPPERSHPWSPPPT